MDYMKILKRAWNVMWSYRALWIFGVLIALTSGGGGNNGGNYNFDSGDMRRWNLPGDGDFRGLERLFSDEMAGMWIAIGLAALCLVLAFAVVGTIVRYVSHTALIRMVDEYERSGEKVGFRQGWRWGWNRAAFRLFLIDLLVSLPIFVVVFGLLGCGAFVLFAGGVNEGDGMGAAIVAMIGMALMVVFVAFLVGIVISLVQPIIRRFAVLENAGVIDSIRGGFGLIRRRFLDVFLMWLILVGLGIAYAIVMIPVVLMLLVAVGLLGGGLGLAVYFGVLAVAGEAAAITAGVLAALPVFLALLVAPALFLEGLRQVYGSSAWTLAYRELNATATVPGAEIVDLPDPALQL